MPETKLEAKDRPSLSPAEKKAGLVQEVQTALEKPVIHQEADAGYYSSILGPTLGNAIYKVMVGRQRERMKAFENPDVQNFFRNIFKVVENKAHELGYFAKDIVISPKSGITPKGELLIRLEPRQGAKKVTV